MNVQKEIDIQPILNFAGEIERLSRTFGLDFQITYESGNWTVDVRKPGRFLYRQTDGLLERALDGVLIKASEEIEEKNDE